MAQSLVSLTISNNNSEYLINTNDKNIYKHIKQELTKVMLILLKIWIVYKMIYLHSFWIIIMGGRGHTKTQTNGTDCRKKVEHWLKETKYKILSVVIRQFHSVIQVLWVVKGTQVQTLHPLSIWAWFKPSLCGGGWGGYRLKPPFSLTHAVKVVSTNTEFSPP